MKDLKYFSLSQTRVRDHSLSHQAGTQHRGGREEGRGSHPTLESVTNYPAPEEMKMEKWRIR